MTSTVDLSLHRLAVIIYTLIEHHLLHMFARSQISNILLLKRGMTSIPLLLNQSKTLQSDLHRSFGHAELCCHRLYNR